MRLPREVRPHPLQSRHLVFQLGQFDRQAGLVRLGAAGEDVEDQLRAVEDLQPRGFFEIAGLAGAEIVVEEDHVGHLGVGQGGQFLHLSLAQVGCRIGRFAALRELAHDAACRRLRQDLPVLPAGPVRGRGRREKDAHEDGRLARHALGAADFVRRQFVSSTGRESSERTSLAGVFAGRPR